ncbi:diguanylate cyclase [Spirochaeta dissipatitropha]
MTFVVIVNQLEGSFFSAQWRVLMRWSQQRAVRLVFVTGKALESPIPMERIHNFTYSMVIPEQADAILVYSGSLGNFTGLPAVEQLIKRWGNIPVVAMNCPEGPHPTICVESSQAVSDLVEHMVVDHGFRSFGLVSGEMTNFDARERHALYLENLESRGVPTEKIRVFNGDFGPDSGSRAADYFLKTGLPDAILCANDDMAHNLMLRLAEHNIFVPEDVAVTGFDGLEFGRSLFPALTTIDQPHNDTVYRSAELLMQLLSDSDARTPEPSACRFQKRQSCGCFDSSGDLSRSKYLDLNEPVEQGPLAFLNNAQLIRKAMAEGDSPHELHYPFLSLVDSIVEADSRSERLQLGAEVQRHYFFNMTAAEQIQSTSTFQLFIYQWKFRTAARAISSALYLRDLLHTFEEIVPYLDLQFCRLYLFEDELSAAQGIPEPPEHMLLHFEYNAGAVCVNDEDGLEVPPEHLYSENDNKGNAVGSSLIKTLFYGDTIIGMLQLGAEENFDMLFESLRETVSISLRHIHMNMQMQDTQRQLELSLAEASLLNKSLKELSIRDDLTGLLNRRGFFQLAEEILGNAAEGQIFHILYIDMDGLKLINDNFGHNEGDWAIREFSQILKAGFRANDVVARIGGDEFAVLAQIQPTENPQLVQRRIQKLLDKKNRSENRGFLLSCSLGSSRFRKSPDTDLLTFIAEADSELYENKILKRKSEA